MRRFLVTLGVLAVMAAPVAARGNDQTIAETIVERLQTQRDHGKLKGFKIDLEVDRGTVWVKGHVANPRQQTLVLDIARTVPGVKQVVNDVSVKNSNPLALPPAPQEEPIAEPIAEPFEPAKRMDFDAKIPDVGTSTAGLASIPVASAEEDYAIQPAQNLAPADSGDQQIASVLVGKLSEMQQMGVLQGCSLDLHVEDGSVVLEGQVASKQQQTAILEVARRIRGVRQVVNGIRVNNPIRRTAAGQDIPYYSPNAMPAPAMVGSSMPVPMGQRVQPANAQIVGSPGPVPSQMPTVGGTRGVSYDHPQLPGYAWPSYAAHPNYAAVSYPRQYSPSAWPYIGPFYPYPQVPLGWRHVALKWKDGWWFLDFSSK